MSVAGKRLTLKNSHFFGGECREESEEENAKATKYVGRKVTFCVSWCSYWDED